MSGRFTSMAAIGFALASFGGAQAQDATPEIAQIETDWSIYVAENPKECFVVASPSSWSAKRDGKEVTVSRSEIRFYVSIIPSDNVVSEPSFLAGYPLAPDSTVEFHVDDTVINLYPNKEVHAEFAWPRPDDDAALIDAMKSGSLATVIGTSTRGTVTTDIFSLLGFTAAMEKATELCQ